MPIFNKKIILILFLLPSLASAATLSLIPKGQTFNIGQEFSVDLVVNTEGAEINAAQAAINFPTGVLKFVSADRSKSAFNFWVEDPNVSSGNLSFIGGTDKPVSGSALNIFTARFKAVGAGTADLKISDGIVTASDGKGTNILSTVSGTAITVSPSATPIVTPPPVEQEQPEKIVRKPAPAVKLPALPKLRVTLYPDPTKWYKHVGDLIVLWEVPDDVIQVAAVLDQAPKTAPTKFDKELFNGKNFGSLKDGIWYVHARFKNNVGSGPTAHYRIAIDTVPPVPFDIIATEGFQIEGAERATLKTDNPKPVLHFSANDALSGVNQYLIQINGEQVIKVEKEEWELPLQAPGHKTLSIKAIDNAGNAREKSLILEIIPIASPVITAVSKEIFVGEGSLLVKGTAQPEYIVKIAAKRKSGEIEAETLVTADKTGNWEAIIDQPLKKGQHFLEVVSQDNRGALSLIVKSDLFKVKERPLFIISGIGITQSWFFTGLILILLGGFAIGWLIYHLWAAQVGRKVVVAQRDVVNAFDMIGKDLEKALSSYSDRKIEKRELSEIEFLLKKIKDNSQKMKKYITENIDEISK